MWQQIELLFPQRLWLLLLVPALILLYLWRLRRAHPALRLSGFPFLSEANSWVCRLRHLPFALKCLALALMISALSHPRDYNISHQSTVQGIDLALILDTSGSMQAVDLKPNRFEAARAVAQELIANRPNDNIGLVAFAGESFTQCPTTTDHATLLALLAKLRVGLMEDGTAIGLGITNGINALREGTAKSKVMILLTDGSNNAGGVAPLVGAQMAKAWNIRIYTVAVGTYGKAQFPVQTATGIRYVEEEVTIDEDILKQVASTTGGKYYRATDNGSLERIYKEIDSLEKSKILAQSHTTYRELFPFLLWWALGLVAAAFVLESTLFKTNP